MDTIAFSSAHIVVIFSILPIIALGLYWIKFDASDKAGYGS